MMTLMRAKHWQLFTIFFALPFVVQMVNIVSLFQTLDSDMETLPSSFFMLFIVAMALAIVGALVQWAWQWTMGTELHKRLPEGVKMNLTLFKLAIFVPAIATLGILSFVFLFLQKSGIMDDGIPTVDSTKGFFAVIGILVPLYCLLILSVFYVFYFCGKALKSVEMGKEAEFSDYAIESVLVWFSPIGVWILQPRLNRLFASESVEKNDFIDQI